MNKLRLLFCSVLTSFAVSMTPCSTTHAKQLGCPERPASKFVSYKGALRENNHFGRIDAKGDIELCAKFCSEHFLCRSFDFNKTGGQCWPSRETKDSKPEDWDGNAEARWIYFERDDQHLTGAVTGFKAFFGQSLPEQNDCTYHNISKTTCSELCIKTPWCNSFDYDRKISACYLSKGSAALDNAKTKPSKDFVYYERQRQINPNESALLVGAADFPNHQLVSIEHVSRRVGRENSKFMNKSSEKTDPACLIDDPLTFCDMTDSWHYEEAPLDVKKDDILLIRLESSVEANLLISSDPVGGRLAKNGSWRGPEYTFGILQSEKKLPNGQGYVGTLVYKADEARTVWISFRKVNYRADKSYWDALLQISILKKK